MIQALVTLEADMTRHHLHGFCDIGNLRDDLLLIMM